MIALLLLALAFRWDYKATKSEGLYIVKWKVDRWANQTWVELYRPSGFREYPNKLPGYNYPTSKDKAAWSKRHTLTRVWTGVFLVSIAWLLWAAWLGPSLRKRRLLNQENDVLQVEAAFESEEPPAVTSSPEPKKEPNHETITCYHCNEEYSPWKCPNCKEELEPADENLEIITALVCPLCKTEYNPWVCPHCEEEAEQRTGRQMDRDTQPLKEPARKKQELGSWGMVFFIWIVIDLFARRFITISYDDPAIGISEDVLVYRTLFSAVFWALLPLFVGIKTKRYLLGFGGAIITMFLGCVVNIVGMLVAIGSVYYMLSQERQTGIKSNSVKRG
ncbi:MAG: hypothetical protein C4570_00280 [Ammonifex sp.]|jgi:hypothetical protein|nr:MAG: hypothetical protein C4570_00280 [Ammonifex sp.]